DAAPGTGRGCQLAPPSTVRRTVPFAPLAHATLGDTALRPRRRAVTPLFWSSHSSRGAEGGRPKAATTRRGHSRDGIRGYSKAQRAFRFQRTVNLVGTTRNDRTQEH